MLSIGFLLWFNVGSLKLTCIIGIYLVFYFRGQSFQTQQPPPPPFSFGLQSGTAPPLTPALPPSTLDPELKVKQAKIFKTCFSFYYNVKLEQIKTQSLKLYNIYCSSGNEHIQLAFGSRGKTTQLPIKIKCDLMTSSLFRDTDESGSNGSPVKLVANLLHVQHRIGIDIWVRDLEQSLVLVGVKFFVQSIHLFQSVSFKHLQ